MKLKHNFVIRDVAGETVAVSVGNNAFRGMIKLNKTGRFVFENLQMDTNVDELAEKLSSNFQITKEEAVIKVEEFVNSLKQNGLVE